MTEQHEAYLGVAIAAAMLLVCVYVGDLVQRLSDRWKRKPGPAKPYVTPRSLTMRTPCDHCGAVEGELLAVGMWHADGEDEGEMIEVEHYVMCRHCREQAFARCLAVLDRKVTVG